MCSSKTRVRSSSQSMDQNNVANINGRPVLQPTCNRVPSLLERRNSLKKTTLPSPLPSLKGGARARLSPSPPISPKQKSPRVSNDSKGSSCVNSLKKTTLPSPLPSPKSGKPKLLPSPPFSPKLKSPKTSNAPKGFSCVDKSPASKSTKRPSSEATPVLRRSNTIHVVEGSGSVAAARREQVANMQAMRKMRIAHYGRTSSAKYLGKVVPIDSLSPLPTSTEPDEKRRCDFISSNSDPIYVSYHDEEWGVPVHDDQVLFELLVLTTAQVGSDWTSVLKKRQHFRDAFSGFDAEVVAAFNERKVMSICSEYGIELSQVRGAIDNATQILKIKEQFGSFDDYLWRFVNYKPICTHYKTCLKIPVKTSKSEAISKDMIKRGLRFVGPAVIHSFMQAAGLTNDHLITCHRHSFFSALAK